MPVAERRFPIIGRLGDEVEVPVEVRASTPIPFEAVSWYRERFAATNCGLYALAAIPQAEPWALRFAGDIVDAILDGALSRPRRDAGSIGEALTKLFLLNGGQGCDIVETARIEIRNHEIVKECRDVIAGGLDKRQAVEALATKHNLSVRQIYRIIGKDI
jgi:hypothetical protein